MSSHPTPRTRLQRRARLLVGLIITSVMIGAVTVPSSAAPPESGPPASAAQASGLYIVQMVESPTVAYTGGIPGLRATKPAQGRKLDPLNADVIRYGDHLKARHDEVLRRAGGGRKAYDYVYAFNGFAAELSPQAAAKLATIPGVIAVTRDEAQVLDTASTPSFLGLTGSSGVWQQLGTKGENVIIGIVDGGIWPESASLSDRTDTNGNGTKDGKLGYQQIRGWNGRCVPGENFTATNCNQKVIGARYYNEGWGGNAGIDALLPWEYNSPRDFGGHGTHVASTAAGNENTVLTGDAAPLGAASGIAPRARIAAYKVCWQTSPAGGGGGSCFNSDSVAAIDQAVADGVDVINFSISGSRTSFRDPVEIAFLFAADAGIFVAASAGNSGPTASTVAHPGPWLTTVAAGTHNRDGQGSVTLGNGATYEGSSVATTVTAPLIDATAAGLPGANPFEVSLCFPGVLDPAVVTGKVVVCDRGVNARTEKSASVKAAGGVGMILVNTSVNSLNADLHFVPTVHLQSDVRAAVKAYAATPGATATINQSTLTTTAPAPFTASFSSRGPLLAGGGDMLKPDLIAPGQDILAAVAPPGNFGRDFDLYSGTSMSSPHVAGLAALFKQKYPSWSPMAIKSALMTSGTDVLDGPGTSATVIFRQGAGHVAPRAALETPLVYDSNYNDWLAFLCADNPGFLPSTCSALSAAGYSLDRSDLNVPSIAIGDLAGQQTVTRKLTNLGTSSVTVSASVTGMTGTTVTVTPGTLTIPAGATRSFTVTVTRAGATLNTYTGGYLTWANATVRVRTPIVVRPVALAAPASFTATPAVSSYDVRFGYDGPFSATPRGLVPATITTGTVADDPTDGACSLDSPNAQRVDVVVPVGTTYARFELFSADSSPGADIDLCVFAGSFLVGSSGTGGSDEEVNLVNPAAGTYTVVVQGWGVVGTSPYALHTWLLDDASAGNMTVTAPATAAIGATGQIGVSFTGLAPGVKYLGSVAYSGSSGMPNPTIVRVDAPPATP